MRKLFDQILAGIPLHFIWTIVLVFMLSCNQADPSKWSNQPVECLPEFLAPASEPNPIDQGERDALQTTSIYMDVSGTMRGFLVRQEDDVPNEFVFPRLLKMLKYSGEHLEAEVSYWKFGACVQQASREEFNEAATFIPTFNTQSYYTSGDNLNRCPDSQDILSSKSNIAEAVRHSLDNPSDLAILITDMTIRVGDDSGGIGPLESVLAQAMAAGRSVGLIGVRSRFSGRHVDLERTENLKGGSVTIDGYRPCYVLLLGEMDSVRTAMGVIEELILSDLDEGLYFTDIFGDFSSILQNSVDIEVLGNEFSNPTSDLTATTHPDIQQLLIARQYPEMTATVKIRPQDNAPIQTSFNSLEATVFSYSPDADSICQKKWVSTSPETIHCESITENGDDQEFVCDFIKGVSDLNVAQVHALSLDISLNVNPNEKFRSYDPNNWGYYYFDEEILLDSMEESGALFKTLNLQLLIERLDKYTVSLSQQSIAAHKLVLFAIK